MSLKSWYLKCRDERRSRRNPQHYAFTEPLTRHKADDPKAPDMLKALKAKLLEVDGIIYADVGRVRMEVMYDPLILSPEAFEERIDEVLSWALANAYFPYSKHHRTNPRGFRQFGRTPTYDYY